MKHQPVEHVVLRTVDGRVVVERVLPNGLVIDRKPFTGWERARRTQLPRATPAAGE